MDKVELETLVRFIERKDSSVSKAEPRRISVQTSTTVAHITDSDSHRLRLISA